LLDSLLQEKHTLAKLKLFCNKSSRVFCSEVKTEVERPRIAPLYYE